ncbi:hypothetical protein CQW23_24217 [Capsicum baccatum]|uniref:Uncharacterized protein n=1 Tax=Capsicum baccatum TaxID=33114 RepID=A0A2G2VU62_CAPBA|nr:hypothetical protein CQW23_24217 [Capsicum baccatum]
MGSEAELADMLQKSLKGKRYLIVLDDMWKSESWDDVDFMDQDESWNLFKSAFANKALPSEFETMGKRIAEKCHGLPLTILVVVGLLKSKMTIEDWESVAKDVKSFVTNDPDEQCAHVLGLSFGHLTSDLKACLLYFGIFPEDTEIPVTNLMRLWMAEGFLNLEKVLEGEAEKCLQYLINRCLVLVTKKSLDETKIRSRKTIIVNGYARSDITFPKKIWELMQLRHLKLNKFYLPNRPNGSVDKARLLVFSNIQTISNLSPCCCTKEVISGIQNVKKLGIKGDEDDYESFQNSGLFNNLVHLQRLETLSLTLFSTGISPVIVPSAKAFPATLKRLKLERTYLSWPYLDIIAELPNLEVLKLMFNACRGEEWYPIAGGFNRLKLLQIDSNQFKYLNATSDNFLVLERLILSNCHYLKEIPIEFADIHTLQLIDLRWCNPELDASATQIQQEQENIGNQPVDVRILKPLRPIKVASLPTEFSPYPGSNPRPLVKGGAASSTAPQPMLVIKLC